MVIRANKSYENKIKQKIKNYNERLRYAENAGVPKNRLPRKAKLFNFQTIYTTKKEMDKALARLDKFNMDSAKKLKNIGDTRTTEWNYDLFKENRKLAKEYFESEYNRVEKRTLKYAGERDYLNTISAKIDVLDKDMEKLSGVEYQAGLRAIEEFMNAPMLRKNNYRQFLNEVEAVMETIGVDKNKRNEFFKKFETLTPTQFLYAYDNNDVINRVYALYFKRDVNGEVIINTNIGSAKAIIDDLFEQVDYIIEDAKLNSD